jgi:hypothetical protein
MERFKDIPGMRVQAADQETWPAGGDIHYKMPMMRNRLSSQCQKYLFSYLISSEISCSIAYCENENGIGESSGEDLE